MKERLQGLRRLFTRERWKPYIDPRQVELDFLRENSGLISEIYGGQWIIIEGEAIVAAGRDPLVVIGAARRAGIRGLLVDIDAPIEPPFIAANAA